MSCVFIVRGYKDSYVCVWGWGGVGYVCGCIYYAFHDR